jgi:hypothetical protein
MSTSGLNSKEQPLKTILVMVLGFMGLSYFLKIPVLSAVAAGIGIMALVSGWLALKLHQGWMGLARVLGRIFPPVFMGIIYFCILSPIGLLARVTRKPRQGDSDTVFVSTDKTFVAEDLKNMW